MQVSRLHDRYSFRHNLFCLVQSALRPAFDLLQNAPLPSPNKSGTRGFGTLLSPVNYRREITRPVSYYALFK